jgi:hypothetical protein
MTLVVQLTGLLLLVPSSQQGEVMNVLLPKNVPQHHARLVFGVPSGNANAAKVCMLQDRGICHVDLKIWEVQTLGAGGEAPSPGAKLPDGILNVTHLSGGPHKAAAGQALRRVTLGGGWARPDPCRLATWSYTPVGKPKDTRPLVNVLAWEIKDPDYLELVFTRANGNEPPVNVPIIAENGRAEILLAHVHDDEVSHLPPNKATTVGEGSQHFDWYYTLLTPQPADRPVPTNPNSLNTPPCPVDVTTIPPFRDEPDALGTYACMIATAEGS